MNHEAELAQLMIQMGTERGLDVEAILAELSWAQFPSFVDANAVRESLVDAVESWWRTDLENRINQLRNQFIGGSVGPGPVATPPVDEPQSGPAYAAPVEERDAEPVVETAPTTDPTAVEAAPVAASEPVVEYARTNSQPVGIAPVVEPPSDATVEGMAVDASPPPDPSEAMPNDATMIWNTRGG